MTEKYEPRLDWSRVINNLPENMSINIKSFEDVILREDREKTWLEKNFPSIIISDKVPKNEIFAVNFKGIVDDLREGKTYEIALERNSARITGLFVD